MKHIEYEERVMIKENDYLKVIEDIKLEGKPLHRFLIENIYLDNKESFIYSNKMMLRIRIINNQEKELTLKIKNPDNSTVEINETVERHHEIDKRLPGALSDYKEIARLITNRIEVQYKDYLFVIDKNTYHGVIDYDLEVETTNQQKAIDIIKQYCEKYNLQYDPHYRSKSHRAISLIKNKKKR